MNLVSMKLTPAEAKTEAGEGTALAALAAPEDQPAYPCGLTIYLDDEALAKLGMTALPDVGTPLTLVARVEVCSKSQYQNQDGTDTSLSMQITDMALAPETQSPEQRAAKFYSNTTT
ncbi:hypothetical protein WS67_12165 [Burkholderia singularis]|uniref:Uncharacterized protein n=1 Tax=Burkholderia singularis TaxID=1503053 RepID=A0A118DNZ1_9BURK|nr:MULTISPECIES: hypothetical protein [Burkholderia]KVE27249.1 hypothetical protein WS67_12165 [Burkholderia singularis]KVE33742.1 hypothetical protein WS68_11255 [Burkholderia sp. TSV86]